MSGNNTLHRAKGAGSLLLSLLNPNLPKHIGNFEDRYRQGCRLAFSLPVAWEGHRLGSTGHLFDDLGVGVKTIGKGPMESFIKLFGRVLALVYHCFDRMVILGHIPLLTRPENIVHFFRDVHQSGVITKMSYAAAPTTTTTSTTGS